MELPDDKEEQRKAIRRRTPLPGEPIGECPACGLKLDRVMGYFCPRSDCPCGLGSNITM